jgi:hypothetical protein
MTTDRVFAMNASIHRITQFLIASWILGTDAKRIPTSRGILDRALKRARDKRMLPPWVGQALHFSVARTGLQCVELPAILDWAQSAELTSAPNPSYQYTELRVSPRVARILISKLGISENDATALGQFLSKDAKLALRKSSSSYADDVSLN